MKVLVVKQSEIEEILTLPECIDALQEAFEALSRGAVVQPDRNFLRPEGARGVMALMPCYRGDERAAFGLKTVCVFHGNAERGMDAHQGTVTLFSAETGETLALMNASAITAIRTGAASGLATRLLARPEAKTLAIIGAGVQARTHLRAIKAVRALEEVRVASRTRARCERFAEEMSEESAFPIHVTDDVESAVRGADIIVTATTSASPVLERGWVSPGAHINAVGSFTRNARELDTALMAEGRVFADRRASVLSESGDYLLAAEEGAIGPDAIVAELAELVVGKVKGRESEDDITIFDSVGMALEDLASAQLIYRKARETGDGHWVEL